MINLLIGFIIGFLTAFLIYHNNLYKSEKAAYKIIDILKKVWEYIIKGYKWIEEKIIRRNKNVK